LHERAQNIEMGEIEVREKIESDFNQVRNAGGLSNCDASGIDRCNSRSIDF